MVTFCKMIDKRSRKGMTEFLKGHFRYDTMNHWNNSTSYAHNLKVYSLGLEKDVANKLFDLTQTSEFYERIHDLIRDFGEAHNFQWQAGFNGRSGGYLVLYQGELKLVGSKSRYTRCTFPGRSIDQYEDFEDWDINSLRDRVELVQEFDALADAIVKESVYMAEVYEVQDETYYELKTRKVMVV